MEKDTIKKLEKSIENLREKKSKLFFLVQDTKGNAKGGIRYIYQLAKTLKDNGFNPIILHETKDYSGVGSWMGEEYMEITHQSIDGQDLQVSPEDFLIIPEIYGHVFEQVSQIPSGKIVLCQAYDHMLETIQPGMNWAQYGFRKCITTNQLQAEYIKGIMKNTTFDIIEPLIPSTFVAKDKPSKPIVSIHTRDQRDTMKIIKSFYLKYPQFRWITFRDMRGINQDEFAEYLRDAYVSIWVDDSSGFGTFPLESMASRTPVIGKVPNIKPDWMDEKNGVWTYEYNNIVDILAEFTQNWLEDNISNQLYDSGLETASKFMDIDKFQGTIVETFNSYINVRLENFEEQLNKIKVEEVE